MERYDAWTLLQMTGLRRFYGKDASDPSLRVFLESDSIGHDVLHAVETSLNLGVSVRDLFEPEITAKFDASLAVASYPDTLENIALAHVEAVFASPQERPLGMDGKGSNKQVTVPVDGGGGRTASNSVRKTGRMPNPQL
jgi:hypothetical protein